MATATKDRTTEQQLEELRAQAKQRQDAVNQVGRDQAECARFVEAARQDLRRFYVGDTTDPKTEEKLKATLADAEAQMDQPWGERRGAAQQLAREAETKVSTFIADNGRGLAAAHRATCGVLQERVLAAVEELQAAHTEFRTAMHQWRPLLEGEWGRGQADAIGRAIAVQDERFSQGLKRVTGPAETWSPLTVVDRALDEPSEAAA